MKSATNILKLISISVFVFASLGLAYVLFQLPNWLPNYSTAIDLSSVQDLMPLFQQVYILVGVTVAAGLLAITLLLNFQNQAVQKIEEYQVKEQDRINTEASKKEESRSEIVLGDAEDIIQADSDCKAAFNRALTQVCKAIEASQGAVFQVVEEKDYKAIELLSSYAYHIPDGEKITFRFGEGIAGQVAKEGKVVNLDTVPEGYIQIFSGLGKATPSHLLILPIKEEERVVGVAEISSFKPFDDNQIVALENYFGKLALKLSNSDNVRLEEAKQ